MKTPVAILVRVSTKKQETERQIQDLHAVALLRGWEVVEIVKEEITGSARMREALDQVVNLAAVGKIRKVMVHEVSRVARRNSVAHDFIERLDDVGVSLYWHAQAIETLLPNGKRNPAAGIMFALLAEMARAEKETLVDRINSGLAEARRKGKTLGRPQGSVVGVEALLEKHADVVRGIKAGKSLRDVAARTGKGLSTVKRVKQAMA